MAEPLKISTSKYTKSGKVDVDGKIWDVTLPGAGTELRFSQASRRIKVAQAQLGLLENKLESQDYTEEDVKAYEEVVKRFDENEQIIYDIFFNLFKDNTKDNSEVNKWVNETPTVILMQAFDDLKGQNESAS